MTVRCVVDYPPEMKLWLHRESLDADDQAQISFQEPDDPEDWILLASQEEHFAEFVDMLEDMAEKALDAGDIKEHDRCLELAGNFQRQIPPSKLVM